MNEEFSPLKETKTLVLEKTDESEIFSVPKKKESAKKILFEEATPQKYVEEHLKKLSISKITEMPSNSKFEFEAIKSYSVKIPEKETMAQSKSITEPKVEAKTELEIEKELEPLSFIQRKTELNKESINEKKKEAQSNNKLKPRIGLKARLKIIFFGFLGILTCLSGWAIYNSIEIETLRAQMEAANKTYAINVANYINNLSKSDDLTTDSLFNLQELSDAGILPIQPNVEEHVEYSIKSNWFDRFCNWLSKILK